MSWMLRAWIVACCLWAVPVRAALLDPLAFTSLGILNASDTISINTDTLELTGGASFNGILDPVSGSGIFSFDEITGTNLLISGTRTLGLLSTGDITFSGGINLLGSGGFEVVALGSTTIGNVQTVGGGETVSIAGNHINLRGTVDSGLRPLELSTPEIITLSGETGSGDIGLFGRSGLIITTRTGNTDRTVNLGSGIITLTGRTGSGQITVTNAGEIIGSPGVTIVAPVPLPASVLLFVTGLASIAVVGRLKKIAH